MLGKSSHHDGPPTRGKGAVMPKPPTIGRLMRLIFIAAILLWLYRPQNFGGPPLFVLLAAAVVAPWIASPFKLKRIHWTTANPHYEPLDVQSKQIPRVVTESSAAISPQLEALGFTNRGHFRISGSVPNGGVHVTLFENRQALQYAKLFSAFLTAGGVPTVKTTSLAFFTEFDDGLTLVTANTKTRPLVPRIRVHEGSLSFPWINDPRRLHEIHDACITHFGHRASRIQIDIEDPIDFLRKSHFKETAKFAESGYYHLDEHAGVYRPTWRGAILMSWKVLWPVKPIRAVLAARRSARVLHELGIEPSWP
jgi:hypothetical protein